MSLRAHVALAILVALAIVGIIVLVRRRQLIADSPRTRTLASYRRALFLRTHSFRKPHSRTCRATCPLAIARD